MLDPIGFTVTGDDPEALTVDLPSWRPDATSEIDVVEEVARHYGYENVPKRVPLSPLHGHLSAVQQRRRQVRQVLLGLGISEVMPSPFLSDDELRWAGFEGEVLRITNPLVADEDVLRPSLRAGLLRAVAFNEAHRRPGVALFEIGHVYPPGPGELPDEREMLGVVLAGAEAPAAIAVWRELAAALDAGARIDQQRVPAGLHPTRSATLVAGRSAIGAVGEIAPGVLDSYGITERVAILEVDLSVRPRHRAQARPMEGDEPASVERPRPGVHARRGDSRREVGEGDPPRGRQPARRARAVRHLPRQRRRRRHPQPGLSPAAAGRRPHADRRRHGRRRRPGHAPPPTKLGATLRS